MIRKPFYWGKRPPLYKDYAAAQRIALPRDFRYRGLFVEEAIERRRSIRDYSGKPLTLEQLSLLLHSAYGITEPSHPLRASPSAGALYPLEIYPIVNVVSGLARGVYHYRPRDHSLDLIKEGDFRSSLLTGTGGQDMVLQASVVLVIAAIFQRTRWKYQERAYRYVLLEAGHLGENLYLAATSLGLGPCGIGAFFDDEINRLVGVDGKDEAAVYLVSIGRVS
jgi:SagB-type dehydrogenase family enzyme